MRDSIIRLTWLWSVEDDRVESVSFHAHDLEDISLADKCQEDPNALKCNINGWTEDEKVLPEACWGSQQSRSTAEIFPWYSKRRRAAQSTRWFPFPGTTLYHCIYILNQFSGISILPEIEENFVKLLLPLACFHRLYRRFSKIYLLTAFGYFPVVRAPNVFFTFVKQNWENLDKYFADSTYSSLF